MFGRKAKELMELLTQRNHENELMRAKITELETEVARMHEQEQSVLRAITEAGKTATRIVDEANANAESINAEANATHDRLIAEAKQRVCDAATQANEILAQADAEANSIKAAANEYSDSTRANADKYSENVRTDANIFVERSIMAAQQEVKKRKDVLAELNSLLRSTADYVSDQVLTFTDAIENSAKEAVDASADLCRDIEKCSCGCSSCENPCMAPEEAPEKEQASEAPAEEAPAPAEAEPEEAEAPAEAPDLPQDYSSPAELMHSIYSIEGRDIPIVDSIEEAVTDHVPQEGLAFADEIGEGTPFDRGEPLPVDSELNNIVSEVLKN